jgi:hypothetical protein
MPDGVCLSCKVEEFQARLDDLRKDNGLGN